MPNPVQDLITIFQDPIDGLRIVADDGSRVLDCDPKGDRWITLEKDPYQQEGAGDNRPQVIVGPERGISYEPFIGYAGGEVHSRVEVRVITWDWDNSGHGFTLNDGQVTNDKLRDSITTLIEANKSGPGGDTSIVACWVAMPGVASNEPTGPRKWVARMQIEFMWLA